MKNIFNGKDLRKVSQEITEMILRLDVEGDPPNWIVANKDTVVANLFPRHSNIELINRVIDFLNSKNVIRIGKGCDVTAVPEMKHIEVCMYDRDLRITRSINSLTDKDYEDFEYDSKIMYYITIIAKTLAIPAAISYIVYHISSLWSYRLPFLLESLIQIP